MALEAAVQGAKRPSQTIAWTDADGAAVDLSGATITARIMSLATGASAASDGTFAVTSAAGGVFRWDYGTADVATAGSYQVQFTAAFSSGATPARTLVEPWVVHSSI